ncbi:MAG TPA: ABC transporter permease [Anaerolineales bacterium]|nr:ABC transporter permease [Anaerolineales bacterium]
MFLSFYLALKEIWRNRGRFFLVALVIALITLLVLFIAALGEGLATNNRQYIANLDAQLVVFLDKSDYIVSSSRLDQSVLKAVRRVPGVAAAGPISTSTTAIMLDNGQVLKVSLLGVEPDQPGLPLVIQGRTFQTQLAKEVVIDKNVALRSDVKVGDEITIRSTQGTKDQFFTLQVVGLTEGEAYTFQPTIFVPPSTWERVRPKSASEADKTIPDINVIAVKLDDLTQTQAMIARLTNSVSNIQVADIPTTINNIPGYSAQQGTVQTQGVFTLLIGVLVIGGFFQIQVLQKVPQIGVLKAIGSSNGVVGAAAVIQIMVTTALGVGIGGLFTYVFSLFFPPTIPLVFNGTASALAILALLLIGPAGGLVSVIYAVRIEPLKALRLSQ